MSGRRQHDRRLSLSHCSEAIKLDVSKYQLYHEEKEKLRNAWDRMSQNGGLQMPSETVLVHGNASTGTRIFVRSLQTPVELSNGIFLSGSFANHNGSNQPYSVFGEAILKLCAEVKKDNQSSLRDFVQMVVGHEVSTMTRFLPKFAELLEDTKSPSSRRMKKASSKSSLKNSDHGPSQVTSNARAFQSLSWSFRKLLRALAERCPPILLLLEDLHLADSASLRLLMAIVKDASMSNVLFVATYTDAEAPENDEWKECMSILARKSNVSSLHLQEMRVHEVNQLVAAITEMPATMTFELGQIVWQRTGGNYFLVSQFLELLHEQSLLLYSVQSQRWEWDAKRIERETDISENVADIIVKRIHHLPESAKNVLKTAACLGSQFQLSLVALLVATEANQQSEEETIDERIFGGSIEIPVDFDTSVVESDFDYLFQTGLFESGATGLCKFSHEKVYQASDALIPPGPGKDRLHMRIGKMLYELHEDPTFHEQWMFCSAVDQFNKISHRVHHLDDILELTNLNIAAADLAMAKSAFLVAATYLHAAIKLLEGSSIDFWDSHYQLCLDLYSAGAEMELCAGNSANSLAFISEVFTNGRGLQDKLRAHFVQIQLFGSHGSLEEAVHTGLDVLKKLGIDIHKKPRMFNILSETKKTRKLLKGKSDESLLTAPMLQDSLKLMTLEMLHLVSLYCSIWRGSDIVPLLNLRSLQYSLEYGNSEHTPNAFAKFAVILATAGSIDEAFRFANLSLRMLDTVSEQSKAEVLFVVHSYLYHWKNPLNRSLDPLMKSYRIAMDTGSIEIALMSADSYAMMYTCAGLPLAHVASDMRRFTQQTVDYELNTMQTIMTPSLQYVLNMMGESRDPVVLTGEMMNQDDLLKNAEICGNQVAALAVHRYRLQLATLFIKSEEALQVIEELPKCASQSTFAYARQEFAIALTYIGLFRKLNKRHHLRRARAHAKSLHTWTTLGNVNCHDMLLLLQAEMMTLQKEARAALTLQKDPRVVVGVREAYDRAIASSSRSGYIHNAAMFNERAAIYFKSINDSFWADTYIEKAHSLYGQWNAWGKVRQLEVESPSLREANAGCGASSKSGSIQGRTRFNRQLLAKHEKISFDSRSASSSQSGRRWSVTIKQDTGSQASTSSYGRSAQRRSLDILSERSNHRDPTSFRRSSAPAVHSLYSAAPPPSAHAALRQPSIRHSDHSQRRAPVLMENAGIRRLSTHSFSRRNTGGSSDYTGDGLAGRSTGSSHSLGSYAGSLSSASLHDAP